MHSQWGIIFFSRGGCAWVSGAGPGLEMIGDRYGGLMTRLGGTGSYARREAGRIE